MILLMNSTKTMNLAAAAAKHPRATRPRLSRHAAELTARLRRLSPAKIAKLLDLNDKLLRRTLADLAAWGVKNRPHGPAALVFTGLLYKSLDAATFDAAMWKRARGRLRILSGLYGVLRPLDLIEAYRLEMGCRLPDDDATALVAWWKDAVTATLNRDLKKGEPILSVASLEYAKALDIGRLKGPIVQPVFKEVKPDGGLKNASVHSKKARGALIRHALEIDASTPERLLGFDFENWEAAEEPPESGRWLFTRPERAAR